MPAFDGYKDILQDLKDRAEWEKKLSLMYRMRHSKVGRQSMPYPNAPDMRFPLIDSILERLKAFYFQQLYATDTLASFVSLKPQEGELTTACGGWMDFRLKQRSNLEIAMLTVIDHMLQSAICPLKLFWDNKKKQILFKPRNPLHFIVPKYTVDLTDAHRVVDVLHMSKADYKRNDKFNPDEAFIKLISGKGSDQGTSGQLDQDKMLREGLTCGQTDDDIVLWEVYTKETDGFLVETFSPLQPDADKAVRKSFRLPYDQGIFKSKDVLPFSMFQMEIKDEGFYSPRGLAELTAVFQSAISTMWNRKHEFMDFHARPTYKQTGQVGNLSNIRQKPGQILPPGIEQNDPPQIPIAFDEEIQGMRALAEYRANVPDLGAGQHLTPGRGEGGKVTATQINAIVGQSGIADDMRVRVFRFGLADTLRKSWSLYLQFDKDSMDYIVGSEVANLDKSALHGEYLIAPNGSADSWNKSVQLQKAGNRMQMLQGNPYIEQGELVKSVLELDEPALIKRLYRDPGVQAQRENVKQSMETLLMLNNFGAPVDDTDDDKVHLDGIEQFGTVRMHEQKPISAIQAQLFTAHITSHLQALQKKKDKAFPQYRQKLMPFLQILGQIAQSAPQNVVDMPQQGSAGNPANVQQSQGSPQQQAPDAKGAAKQFDPQGNAAKLMNSLAGLAKVGAPIGPQQLNAVLAQAGLPPIMLAPPQVPGVA